MLLQTAMNVSQLPSMQNVTAGDVAGGRRYYQSQVINTFWVVTLNVH